MSAKSVPLAVRNATRPLRIARALIEVLAPSTAVSWFNWWKPPGNAYVTLFPTDLLPPADDPAALDDAQIGQRLFTEVVAGDHGSVTLGMYGSAEVHVPWLAHGVDTRVWPPPATRGLPPLPGGLTTPLAKREELAVRAALGRMDTRWLQGSGSPDPVTTSAVLSWTSNVLELMRTYPRAHLASLVDEEGAQPRNFLAVDVVSEGNATRRVSWPGRLREAR